MGVVKVWANQDYSQINTHGRVSEEKMVETIIEAVNNIIDKNDQRNKRPVKSYFYLHSDKLKF
jgi:glycosyltransferase involved in cell wall biosynthesis